MDTNHDYAYVMTLKNGSCKEGRASTLQTSFVTQRRNKISNENFEWIVKFYEVVD
jgi:hypothetical protein